jgi:UDP-glucose 4-epimerase
VDAFLAAAGAEPPGIWNIGTGVETSILDLVQIIAGTVGHTVHPKFGPARQGELDRSVLAVNRAALELGWRAPTGLAEGIGSVYRWIKAGTPDRAPAGA